MHAYTRLLEQDISKAKKELESFECTARTYPYEVEGQYEKESAASVAGLSGI